MRTCTPPVDYDANILFYEPFQITPDNIKIIKTMAGITTSRPHFNDFISFFSKSFLSNK